MRTVISIYKYVVRHLLNNINYTQSSRILKNYEQNKYMTTIIIFHIDFISRCEIGGAYHGGVVLTTRTVAETPEVPPIDTK